MKSRRQRLFLEQLEDRTTPASVNDLYSSASQTIASSAFLKELSQNPVLLANPILRPAYQSYFTNLYHLSTKTAALLKEFPRALSPTMTSLVRGLAGSEASAARMVGGFLGFRLAPTPPPTPVKPPRPTDSGMTATAPAAADPHFVNLGDGLKIWDVVQGKGAAVEANATVNVFYTGWLAANGTKFDSRRSPSSPANFKLANTIQGWQQGVVGMKDGGIRRLFVPAALAYGAAGSGSIPANADLIFEIKLVSHTKPTPGAADPAHSIVSVTSTSLQSGGKTTVTLTAKDAHGIRETTGGLSVAFGLGAGVGRGTFSTVTDHGNGTYTATFTGTTVGANTITATIGGQAVTSTAPTVTVVGPVNLSHSSVSVASTAIQSGTSTTVTLTAKDANGAQETKGGLSVVFSLGAGVGRGTFSGVTDHGNGTYSATFTGTTTGANTIKATVGGQPVSSTVPTVTIIGPVNLSHSVVSIISPAVQAGATTTVTLTAKDANGAQETKGGLSVVFVLGAGVGRGTFSGVSDHGNGTYTATFTATTAGTNTIKATIGGQPVASTAPTVTVVGPADLSHSLVSVTSPAIHSGGTTMVTLTAKDANGVQETKGGLTVVFGLGSGVGRGTFTTVTDHADGTYTATFTGTIAGSNTITGTIGGQLLSSAASITVTI